MIAEIAAIRGGIANYVGSNPAAASPSLNALDATLATLSNEVTNSDGTSDLDALAADTAAVDAAWDDSSDADEEDPTYQVGDPPVGGGTQGGITLPGAGGVGPKTDTTIPPFDPTNPFGSIGGRLKWRWQNGSFSGGIYIQTPNFPGAPGS